MVCCVRTTLYDQLLVECHANVNVTDNKGYSALYYVIRKDKFGSLSDQFQSFLKTEMKCLPAIQVLLYYGAETDLMGCSTCYLLRYVLNS